MADDVVMLAVDSVVYQKDVYPRINTNPATVQKYAEDLAVLPPIEVNQDNVLIDGWHRWTAHVKNGAKEIPAIVTTTESDTELLELAIARNATHGLQLSNQDKKKMAAAIYRGTPVKERGGKKERLAKILSVSKRTVDGWLQRIDKNAKEERDCTIRDMWFACHTQEQIAEAVGVTHQSVGKVLQQNANLRFVAKPGVHDDFKDDEEEKRLALCEKENRAAAAHETEFERPIYSLWKQQNKSSGITHFGNSEARWLDNLLYMYTDPFDIVVDPFAGGGSTIDVCKQRFRRYWVSDRKPIVERASEIREHDITEGLPSLPRWQDVKLVYLDPPYWRQAEGEYSDDPTDLANMPVDEFHSVMAGLIKDFLAKIPEGAIVAMIIAPTQWKAPDKRVIDHALHIQNKLGKPWERFISAPYESQQNTAQMVEWAKKERDVLEVNRNIYVWRK